MTGNILFTLLFLLLIKHRVLLLLICRIFNFLEVLLEAWTSVFQRSFFNQEYHYFFIYILIGGKLVYNVVLVSAIRQYKNMEHFANLCVMIAHAWMHTCVLSRVWLFAIPWTVACHAPLSRNFPGKNTRVSCQFLFQGIFSTPGWNSCLSYLLRWQADSWLLRPLGSPILMQGPC